MDIVQQESTTAACKLLEVLLDTSHNVSSVARTVAAGVRKSTSKALGSTTAGGHWLPRRSSLWPHHIDQHIARIDPHLCCLLASLQLLQALEIGKNVCVDQGAKGEEAHRGVVPAMHRLSRRHLWLRSPQRVDNTVFSVPP